MRTPSGKKVILTKKAGLIPSARASAREEDETGRDLQERPRRRDRSAIRPTVAASSKRRSDERAVEGRDGADKQGGAEHVGEVGERVEARGMSRHVPDARLFQRREPLRVGRRTSPQLEGLAVDDDAFRPHLARHLVDG